jgi:PadR family transcriptional regulator, regulatory protein AphA
MPLRTKTSTEAPPVTATEVAVLGLLAEGERSGYDLLRAAGRSVGFFWTPAKTQLYAVLRKLVENGFATSRLVRQHERPDKTLYRLTELGLERFRDGLEQVHSTVNKNPLELRIFFGEHRPLEAVVADLEGVRDRAREHLEELEEIEGTFDHGEYLFPYLTLLRGKENARADVAWAEQALELLRK